MSDGKDEMATLVLFHGDSSRSRVENELARVRKAIAEETVERALQCSNIGSAVVCTDCSDFVLPAGASKPVAVHATPTGHHFHFGRELRRVIAEGQISTPFYMGGASAPLMSVAEMDDIAAQVLAGERVVVTNNIHSSDFVAFRPGEALQYIDPPEMDNSLAYLLRDAAGLKAVRVAEGVGSCFDVDTPTDALILGAHPRASEALRQAVKGLGADECRLHKAREVLVTPFSDVLLWGRVGPSLLTYLNQFTRCRWRVISEERGMKALGRLDRGEVVSVLGFLLQEVGIGRFFSYLSKLCRLAVVDSRVLFAHVGVRPTAEDRFLSDLGLWESVGDPFVRDFTRAAVEADIPVILGGHSLVSGGLRALVDALWCEWLDSK